MAFATLIDLYRTSFALHRKADTFLRKLDGRDKPVAFDQARRCIERLAAALVDRGVAPGDRVGLLSEPRRESALADLAVATARAVSVPADPAWDDATLERVFAHAGVKLAFVSRSQLERARRVRSRRAMDLILLEPDPAATVADCERWQDVLDRGEGALARAPLVARARGDQVTCEDPAMISYRRTSSGGVLGVVLTHGGLVAGVESLLHALDLGPEDIVLSHRPAHDVTQRVLDLAMVARGGTVAYASGAGPLEAQLREIRPTLALADGPLLEDVLRRFAQQVSGSRRKRRGFVRASRAAVRARRLRDQGRPVPFGLAVALRFHERSTYRNLRRALGGHLRFLIADHGPVSWRPGALLPAAGIRVSEGFAWPETGGLVALTGPGRSKRHSGGRALRGVELRTAYDGELLVRSAAAMVGFHEDPEATAEVLEHRWFRTGMTAELDAEGFLTLAGRADRAGHVGQAGLAAA